MGCRVVATELLRRQLGWVNGRELVAVDHEKPARFAEEIVALYRDAARWQALRENALLQLQSENAEEYAKAIRDVLDGSTAAPRLRLAAASE